MKEIHVHEYNGMLLACSTNTNINTKNLQCYSWSGINGWELFDTPASNGVFGFIATVKIPDVGIWFQDNKNDLSLLLLENGTYINAYQLTNLRSRHCAVMIDSTTVAMIGGNSPVVSYPLTLNY